MNNRNAMKFWENVAVSNDINPGSEKLTPKNDWTDIDAEFILKHAGENTSILDIGTGSGLIVNKLYDKVGYVECVEPYSNFAKFITKSSNVKIINENILDFETGNKFDLITAFGIMHYFNEKESIKIYKKCLNWMNPSSKIIIKNQFGINEDVTVSGYSEEQKTDYFAQYRHINKEVEILKNIGFKNIDVVDIYPPEANRWNNTHFYAIVGEK